MKALLRYLCAALVCLGWNGATLAQSPQQIFLQHWQAAHGALAKKACFPAIREFHKAQQAIKAWKQLPPAKRARVKAQLATKLARCYLQVGPSMLSKLHKLQRPYWYSKFRQALRALPRSKTQLQRKLIALAKRYKKPPKIKRPKPGKVRPRPRPRRKKRTKGSQHMRKAEKHLHKGKLLKAITSLRKALRASPAGSTRHKQAQQVLRFVRYLQQIDVILRDQQYKATRRSVRKRRKEVIGLSLSEDMQKKLLALLQRRMFYSYDSEALLATRGLECIKAMRLWQSAYRVTTPIQLPKDKRKALLRCHLDAGQTNLRSKKWRRAITQFRSAKTFHGECSPAQKRAIQHGLAMSAGVRAQDTKRPAHKQSATRRLKRYLRAAPPQSPGYKDASRLLEELRSIQPQPARNTRRRFDVELGLGAIFLPAAGFQAQAAFTFYPFALLGLRIEGGLDSTNPLFGHASLGAMLVLGQTWQFTFKALAGARFRNTGVGVHILLGPGLRYRWPFGLQLGLTATTSIDIYQETTSLLLAAHTTIGFAF